MSNHDIIATLNDLVETCKDGEFGFRTSAEHAKAPALASQLTGRADECRQAASELQTLVSELGGKAEDGGTASGALHRGWVAVRSALSGYTDLAVLEECERGEDVALERYRDALKKELPANVLMVVQRHYEGVKRNHLAIRTMRDAQKAEAHH